MVGLALKLDDEEGTRGTGERIRGVGTAPGVEAGESAGEEFIWVTGEEDTVDGKDGTAGTGDRIRVGTGAAIVGAGERERMGVEAGV